MFGCGLSGIAGVEMDDHHAPDKNQKTQRMNMNKNEIEIEIESVRFALDNIDSDCQLDQRRRKKLHQRLQQLRRMQNDPRATDDGYDDDYLNRHSFEV